MKTVKKMLGAFAVLAYTGSAMAGSITVNFQDLADGAYGESAFQPLSLMNDFGIDVDISGTFDGEDVYAYLDAGNAGLGVCRNLNAAGEANLDQLNPGSGSNLCNPGSDDNVNTYDGMAEGLVFSFEENITITSIWFNNNHDRDHGMTGDTVLINGSEHTFAAGDLDSNDPTLGWMFDFTGSDGDFLTGQVLTIDYFIPGAGSTLTGEEFYISAITFETSPQRPVPLPSTLTLFSLGLAGMAARKRAR